MPSIPGLAIPKQFYQVLDDPAPLGGIPYPNDRTPWKSFDALGFRWVLRLAEGPAYDPAPLQLLDAVELQDLYGGLSPADPQQQERLIREAAGLVAGKLSQGQGVLVHCWGGTGRTGTVLGCALRLLGFESQEVIDYLNRINQARGKPGWPESSWQAELLFRERKTDA